MQRTNQSNKYWAKANSLKESINKIGNKSPIDSETNIWNKEIGSPKLKIPKINQFEDESL